MLPLLALIPIIIGGTIVVTAVTGNLLSDRTKDNIRLAKKIAILGTRGTGKTTLWNSLRGQSCGGGYRQTVGREEIKEFYLRNGQLKVASTFDIGGGDEDFMSSYEQVLKGDNIVVFFLVSAVDMMEGNSAIRNSCARLRKICSTISGKSGCSLVLFLTHRNDFIRKYGKESISQVENSAKRTFGEYTNEACILLELTDRKDVEQIIKLIR